MGWVLGQGQTLERERDWGPPRVRPEWLECLPVGQGLELPATGLASLLLRVVQGLAGGGKKRKVEVISDNNNKVLRRVFPLKHIY